MTHEDEESKSISGGSLPLHLIPDGETPGSVQANDTPENIHPPMTKQPRPRQSLLHSSLMLYAAVTVVFGTAFLISGFLLYGAYITLLL